MRELIGKISTNDADVIQNVYYSENVRCQTCHKTVPIGIEVVTVRTDKEPKKVLKHEYYCRAHAFDVHGVEFETRAQFRPNRKSIKLGQATPRWQDNSTRANPGSARPRGRQD
jgi:hypothetical protein